jgi:2-dehydropantoate 2-reductase
MKMQVVVVGFGSIGAFIGIRLAVDHSVTMIHRSPLRFQDGDKLISSSIDDSQTSCEIDFKKVRFVSNKTETEMERVIGKAHILLICVKVVDNEFVGKQLMRWIRRDSIVICLQNGVDSADYFKYLLPENLVLKGMVGFNVIKKSDLHFHRATSSPIIIERRNSHLLEEFVSVKFQGFLYSF